MDFPLSNLSSLTLSVLGLVTLELSLLVGGTKIILFKALYYKRRESDHTRDMLCQMQIAEHSSFHPVWHLKSFLVVL